MTFKDFVGDSTTGIIGTINLVVIPILFSFAALYFAYKVLDYFVIHGTEDAKREQGKQFALWGVIGLAVLFATWGIVNLLLSTLGISPGL